MPRNQLVARSGKGQTDFSMKNKGSRFPLPKPIELAKLAAILSRGLGTNTDREVKAALTRAMQFYVEAVFLHRRLSGISLNDLIASLEAMNS